MHEKRRVTARPAYSCAFPPSKDVVDYARIAQELGFQCIWIYDSPALYGDQWVALARIAEQVPDIGLATGVAVPSMRHPMVTASAIATIEELSPGRLEVFFGTGFTARLSMGQRGGSWAGLAEYVKQVRGLLAGEVVVIEGKKCRMLHSPGFVPPRPIDVPIGLAPVGPKGFSVSRELTDRVIVEALGGSLGNARKLRAARFRTRYADEVGRGEREPLGALPAELAELVTARRALSRTGAEQPVAAGAPDR